MGNAVTYRAQCVWHKHGNGELGGVRGKGTIRSVVGQCGNNLTKQPWVGNGVGNAVPTGQGNRHRNRGKPARQSQSNRGRKWVTVRWGNVQQPTTGKPVA